MNPNEYHISVSRTARYFTLGELNQNTKDIWIVIHGHRHLAGKFIMLFKELAEEGSFIIAPEGLMRLYIKGENGDVGASWMTKEDRESDIKDYVNYLDKLYSEIIELARRNFSLKVNALGFSQGVATLSRWLALGKSKIDKAVFWTGTLAHDVDFSKAENLKSTDITLVFADNDPYFKNDFYQTQEKLFKDAGISFQTKIFSGGHEVNAELIKSLNIL
ncbi:MAG TPA: dienelactone hydrolase family protein [Ignavibacteria bacterium]